MMIKIKNQALEKQVFKLPIFKGQGFSELAFTERAYKYLSMIDMNGGL